MGCRVTVTIPSTNDPHSQANEAHSMAWEALLSTSHCPWKPGPSPSSVLTQGPGPSLTPAVQDSQDPRKAGVTPGVRVASVSAPSSLCDCSSKDGPSWFLPQTCSWWLLSQRRKSCVDPRARVGALTPQRPPRMLKPMAPPCPQLGTPCPSALLRGLPGLSSFCVSQLLTMQFSPRWWA